MPIARPDRRAGFRGGTLLAMAVLTAIPARIGSRRSVAAILQAETA